VNVISKTALKSFWNIHPESERVLLEWYKVLAQVRCENFNQLRQFFPSADYVKKNLLELTIFDIGGNKYRVICGVSYRTQTVFIKYVFTHREYDEWNKRG
jgi:mRNA interferase HigB